ncbi:MAG: TadE/TadG family type IV pilus assembly protein [Syntrophomonadaceae bacterium]
MLKNERGQAFIEMLFVLPLFLMLAFFIIEMGFVMYDLAVINYAASSTAVEAARQGQFTTATGDRTMAYLRDWSSNGRNFNIVRRSVPGKDIYSIIVYGPGAGDKFQRGDIITIGVCYPVRFKTFLMDALASWTVDEQELFLKARASAMSEVFFEP